MTLSEMLAVDLSRTDGGELLSDNIDSEGMPTEFVEKIKEARKSGKLLDLRVDSVDEKVLDEILGVDSSDSEEEDSEELDSSSSDSDRTSKSENSESENGLKKKLKFDPSTQSKATHHESRKKRQARETKKLFRKWLKERRDRRALALLKKTRALGGKVMSQQELYARNLPILWSQSGDLEIKATKRRRVLKEQTMSLMEEARRRLRGMSSNKQDKSSESDDRDSDSVSSFSQNFVTESGLINLKALDEAVDRRESENWENSILEVNNDKENLKDPSESDNTDSFLQSTSTSYHGWSAVNSANLDAAYDLFQHFSMCIGNSGNQGSCGSCYAFATLQVLDARRCILNAKCMVQATNHACISLPGCEWGDNRGSGEGGGKECRMSKFSHHERDFETTEEIIHRADADWEEYGTGSAPASAIIEKSIKEMREHQSRSAEKGSTSNSEKKNSESSGPRKEVPSSLSSKHNIKDKTHHNLSKSHNIKSKKHRKRDLIAPDGPISLAEVEPSGEVSILAEISSSSEFKPRQLKPGRQPHDGAIEAFHAPTQEVGKLDLNDLRVRAGLPPLDENGREIQRNGLDANSGASTTATSNLLKLKSESNSSSSEKPFPKATVAKALLGALSGTGIVGSSSNLAIPVPERAPSTSSSGPGYLVLAGPGSYGSTFGKLMNAVYGKYTDTLEFLLQDSDHAGVNVGNADEYMMGSIKGSDKSGSTNRNSDSSFSLTESDPSSKTKTPRRGYYFSDDADMLESLEKLGNSKMIAEGGNFNKKKSKNLLPGVEELAGNSNLGNGPSEAQDGGWGESSSLMEMDSRPSRPDPASILESELGLTTGSLAELKKSSHQKSIKTGPPSISPAAAGDEVVFVDEDRSEESRRFRLQDAVDNNPRMGVDDKDLMSVQELMSCGTFSNIPISFLPNVETRDPATPTSSTPIGDRLPANGEMFLRQGENSICRTELNCASCTGGYPEACYLYAHKFGVGRANCVPQITGTRAGGR